MKKIFFVLAALMTLAAANAQTDLIISEYVEGWGSNKALEIFNPTTTAINLKDYKVKRYSGGGTVATSDYIITLPDYSLEPYKTFVITQDKKTGEVAEDESPIWSQLEARADAFFNSDYGNGDGTKCVHWNGDDCVTLEKNDVIIDIFGKLGEQPALAALAGGEKEDEAWTNIAPFNTGEGIGLSADYTLVKKSSLADGIVVNPVQFDILAAYDTFPANTFINLGWHKFDGAPANVVPVFDMNSLFAVSPLAEEGDVAVTLNVIDTDAGQNISYYIVSGNQVYVGEGDAAVRTEPFSLDKATGIITVANETALVEATDDIYFNVVACDEYGQSEIFSFDIRITDEPIASVKLDKVEFSISPNPANNSVVLKSAEMISSVEIFNLVGQKMQSQLANSTQVNINLDLTAGHYIVKTLFANGKSGIEKLIIQ